MIFSDITGHREIIEQLKKQLVGGCVPHAQLFYGIEGCGKLAVALAFARALLCRHNNGGEPCGECNDCKMSQEYAHPDLHFVYPVIKKKGTERPEHTKFIQEWRELLLMGPWFSDLEWAEKMGVDKQQPIIYESQSESLVQALSLMSQQSDGYKVVVVWKAEMMNVVCSNKLLKTLEEPYGKTVFILVTEHRECLLPTILSRLQQFRFKPLKQEEIRCMLIHKNGVDEDLARDLSRIAEGSYLKAMKEIEINPERLTFFDLFVQLMRFAYQRKVIDLSVWSETLASWGREKQKRFLNYCQYLIRENFIYNFKVPELNYLTKKEESFSKNFARYINERNVKGIMKELELAQRDIEANVNAQMVFFDFCLKIIVLLVK